MTYLLARVLSLIVAHDYRERIAGRRPDRWHWADKLLVRLGYATNEHNELRRFGRGGGV